MDKKQNFPGPRKEEASQSSPPTSPAAVEGSSSSTPKPAQPVSSPQAKGKGKGKPQEQDKGKDTDKARVITPELRKLLSRKVEVLPRQTVAQNGDGMPAAK